MTVMMKAKNANYEVPHNVISSRPPVITSFLNLIITLGALFSHTLGLFFLM
jgi:hypothetical protein